MKIKQDKELLEIIDSYNQYMKTDKYDLTSITVSKPIENHKESLYTKEELHAVHPLGNTYITCEVRNGDQRDCTLQILSDIISKKVMFRYDTGGGTHKNDAPHIPLRMQSVTTPHFHRYDDNGYFLAYKSDKLNDAKESYAFFDIDFGFPYFFQEGIIFASGTRDIPALRVGREGAIPFKYDDVDPLEGIFF